MPMITITIEVSDAGGIETVDGVPILILIRSRFMRRGMLPPALFTILQHTDDYFFTIFSPVGRW